MDRWQDDAERAKCEHTEETCPYITLNIVFYMTYIFLYSISLKTNKIH